MFIPSTLALHNHKFVFYVWEFVSVWWLSSFVLLFLDSTSHSSEYYMTFVFLWLHLVWQSLSPLMLLQMALFNSFLCLSSIPLLGKAMSPHSSTVAWKIPWTEEPGRLQSMGSLRVGHDWVTSLSRIGEGNGNPLQCSCLENPRDGGSLVGCRLWGRRVRHDWSDLAAAVAITFWPISKTFTIFYDFVY